MRGGFAPHIVFTWRVQRVRAVRFIREGLSLTGLRFVPGAHDHRLCCAGGKGGSPSAITFS